MSLPELRSSIESGFNFTLKKDKVVNDSLTTFWKKATRPSYAKKKAEIIAEKILFELQACDRVAPHLAEKNEWYQLARLFRKKISYLCPKSPVFNSLLREEVAFALGLNVNVFLANPKLFEYARETNLSIYIAYHRDSLKIDEDNQVSLRIDPKKAERFGLPANTTQAKWNKICKGFEQAFLPKFRAEKFSHYPFNNKGLTIKCFYREPKPGKELKLRKVHRTLKEDKPWGNRFAKIILVHSEGPGIKGNHTWSHLVTPSGDIYSTSDYRPKDPKALFSCAPLKGRFANPDSSDTTPGYPSVPIAIELTKEEFDIEMKLELDKLNGRAKRGFYNLDGNCTTKAIVSLEAINIKVPDFKVSFLTVYLPQWLVRPSRFVYQHLPVCVAKIIYFIVALFGNIAQGYYKGFQKNPELPDEKPTLRNWKDVFIPSKLDHSSPYYLIQGPIKELKAWREKVKNDPALLAKYNWTKADVDYQIPWRNNEIRKKAPKV